MTKILIKKCTNDNIETASSNSQLNQSELYHNTDNNNIILGTSDTTYTILPTVDDVILKDGKSGGQHLIGGTNSDDGLILQSTSAAGSSNSSVSIKVGDYGNTEALSVANNGNIGINNNAPKSLLTIGNIDHNVSIGPEMIISPADRNFTANTGNWTGGWVITDDKATASVIPSNFILNPSALNESILANELYIVSIDVDVGPTEELSISVGGSNIIIHPNTHGINTVIINTSTTINLTMFAGDNVSVNSISLRHILATNNQILEIVNSVTSNQELMVLCDTNSIYIGTLAGKSSSRNVAKFNTAYGIYSLATNYSGTNNTAIGNRTLVGNLDSNNTAVGSSAGRLLRSGTDNTFVGYFSGGFEDAALVNGYQEYINNVQNLTTTCTYQEYTDNNDNLNIILDTKSITNYFNVFVEGGLENKQPTDILTIHYSQNMLIANPVTIQEYGADIWRRKCDEYDRSIMTEAVKIRDKLSEVTNPTTIT